MMSQDNRLVPVPGIDRALDRPLSEIAQAKPYGISAAEPTNVRDYLHVVLKRKWLILSLVVVITSLATIQMFRQPSIYEGKTTIRIEPKPKSVLQTKELVINSTDPNFWGTQLKLLENPSLARQVVTENVGEDAPHGITHGSSDGDRCDEGREVKVEGPRAENEYFERRRRRQDAGDYDRQHSVSLVEILNSIDALLGELSPQQWASAFPSNRVQEETTCNRAYHRHAHVIGHSLPGFSGGENDNEYIIAFRN